MIYQDLVDILFARGDFNKEIKVSVLVSRSHASTAVETIDVLFAGDRLVVELTEAQVRQLGVE